MAEEQQTTNAQDSAPEDAATGTPETTAEAPAAPAPADPVAPTPVQRERKQPPGSQIEQYHGLGRRKTATARVLLRPGEGRWTVNGRSLEVFLPRAVLRQAAAEPFAVTETVGRFDVKVSVDGGGQRGQAEAIRLGIARALLQVDEEFRPRLRAAELLTRDAREVERKKPGRPKARKRFQFSKR